MRKILTLLIATLTYGVAISQTDSTTVDSFNVKGLSIYGGVDVYYLYDLNEPESKNRPGFEYSHTRHNQFSVNTGVLGFNYEANKVRSNFGIVFGDYAMSNLSAEPLGYQNLYEANVGVKIIDRLWFDVGIFESHIGTESALSWKNHTLTRSIVANSSPYFETGAKLTYNTKNEKWLFSALALNGWQNIKDNNENKAFGSQISFMPKDGMTINYSGFVGNPYNDDSTNATRVFNDFYVMFDVADSTFITFQFDYGIEEGQDWYGFTFIAKQMFSERYSMVGRVEYFQDYNELIYVTGTPNGFDLAALSIGMGYKVTNNVLFRTEAKMLFSADDIFEYRSGTSNQDVVITSSLSFNFKK